MIKNERTLSVYFFWEHYPQRFNDRSGDERIRTLHAPVRFRELDALPHEGVDVRRLDLLPGFAVELVLDVPERIPPHLVANDEEQVGLPLLRARAAPVVVLPRIRRTHSWAFGRSSGWAVGWASGRALCRTRGRRRISRCIRRCIGRRIRRRIGRRIGRHICGHTRGHIRGRIRGRIRRVDDPAAAAGEDEGDDDEEHRNDSKRRQAPAEEGEDGHCSIVPFRGGLDGWL